MPERSKGKKGKRSDAEALPVETEIIVRSSPTMGRTPGTPLSSTPPVAHCFRCLRKDILVLAVLEGRMVGLCPDHFKMDVMTYVP